MRVIRKNRTPPWGLVLTGAPPMVRGGVIASPPAARDDLFQLLILALKPLHHAAHAFELSDREQCDRSDLAG